ncbi:hypothetical protein ATO7_05300 [Oceanococcus atlanticus]|uniref:Uncharacterized protein n=1 Tax=Oceanococcus atlanticus TaxID=1317117 RepID=A0A1Y1SJ96_9GAMM|nr:hypothetical protein ATO7_05300 [Oceanococcus atlanticus]
MLVASFGRSKMSKIGCLTGLRLYVRVALSEARHNLDLLAWCWEPYFWGSWDSAPGFFFPIPGQRLEVSTPSS